MRWLVEFLRSNTCSFATHGKVLFAVAHAVRSERLGADRTLAFFILGFLAVLGYALYLTGVFDR
jgi:hypothetical protein